MARAPQSCCRILVVDDYEPLRFLKAHVLARAGFTVSQAENGCEALSLVREERPDVVLLDLNLPDMHGSEVCRRIKAGAPATPVIYTSSVGIPEEFSEADGCVVGAGAQELLQAVRALLPPRANVEPPPPLPVTNGRPPCLSTQFAPAERLPLMEVERQSRGFHSREFAAVLDACPSAMAVLNDNRQIVLCNRALLELAGACDVREVLGLRPGELLQCVHAREAPGGCGTSEFCQTCAAVRSVLEGLGGHRTARDCRITRNKDGAEEALDLRVSAAPLEGHEGFVLCSIADISHEKRRRALERLFLHDLLNMAGGLEGLAAEIRGAAPEGTVAEWIELIGSCAAELIYEIRSQQQLLEAESHELAVSLSELDALRFLRGLVERYRGSDAAQGREVRLDEDSPEIAFTSDGALLARVLGNMLKNALEATPPGGTVTAGVWALENEVDFRVHNPGAMPKEARLQVFQRSFSTKGEGRGLGAYSMKLLGERYLGGRISFRSEAAEGTTFSARFPLAGPRRRP